MKTALLSALYLDRPGDMQRTTKWLEFHKPLFPNVDIWFVDNASECGMVSYIEQAHKVNVIRFAQHLPKGEGFLDYPYCWRALWFVRYLVENGYEKIINLDTDCYIASKRLLDHIHAGTQGWEAFWIPKYRFPSSECHIINPHGIQDFMHYTNESWKSKVGQLMEDALPFTYVNRWFKIDRFGEDKTPQTPDMDGYFQAKPDQDILFDMEGLAAKRR